MRRFNITSTKYAGAAELVYDNNGLLKVINMSATNMDAEQVHAFKAMMPLTIKHLEAGTGITPTMTVIEADFVVSFDMFWEKYDKKINRKRCTELWAKMSKADQVAAWDGIDNYLKYLKKESWRKQLDPENYLRTRSWENEWK